MVNSLPSQNLLTWEKEREKYGWRNYGGMKIELLN